MFGAQAIMLGLRDVVVCGGMESMSNAPYYSAKQRAGARLGHVTMEDGIIKDGLWDACGENPKGQHMGDCAEMCAVDHSVSREDQDAFALRSQDKRDADRCVWQRFLAHSHGGG